MASNTAYGNLSTGDKRDSLELASLASSSPERSARSSLESSSSGVSSSRRLSNELANLDDPLTNDVGRPGGRSRSYSVGSTFDFGGHMFPLSSTGDSAYISLDPTTAGTIRHGVLEKIKTVTFLNGVSLVVGLQIGSGIFSSPSQVNVNAGSPGASLIVWLVAGVLAWTGAASYAELGSAIPLSGGPQAYLQHIFGDLPSFLFAWTAVMVLKPGSTAIISIIFGEYLNAVFAGALAEDSPRPPEWTNKLVALLGIMLITLLNCISTKLGTRMGNVFMAIKLMSLLAVTVVGIVVAITGFSNRPGGASIEWKTQNWFTGSSHNPGDYAIALYAGLWAFDGWDNVNYITGEMVNPTRDLPRVIHVSMPLVIVSYLLANVAYFFVLPSSVIAASNTIAVRFGTTVFGPIGGILFALAVSISCLGALNAGTFTSGRLVYVAGKEGYLPQIFGTLGFRGGSSDRKSFITKVIGVSYTRTPIYAMLLNAALTSAYVIIGDFAVLLTFYGVAGYTFYLLTVLGLIVLRVKEPDLQRPYKCWITTPIIFCCVSLFLVSRGVFGSPIQTLIVVAFVMTGIPVFWWRVGLPRWMKNLAGKGARR